MPKLGRVLSCGVVALTACGAPAEGQPAGGVKARYEITLEYRGVWGLTNEGGSSTCPGVPPGFDRFTGVLEGIEPPRGGPAAAGASPEEDDGEGVVEYAGVLTRETEVGLCEAKETTNGTEWCAGHLSGKGPFRVTIKVPYVGYDSADASIEFEPEPPRPPLAPATASVSGSCDSLDNAALADDYTSRDAMQFETIDASGSDLMPTGGLTPGLFRQTRHWRQRTDEYTLRVRRLP